MLWLHQYLPVWRVAALALLLVALLGPWWFDRIYVPSQYSCSAPFVRLEGDFCGVPMSGMYILFGLGARSLELVFNRLTGATAPLEPTDARAVLSFSLVGLALVLPFLTTLFLIWQGNCRSRQVVHLGVWGLAASAGLLLGVSIARPLWAVVLWGNWLYVGVAAGALIAEAAMLLGKRDPRGRTTP